MHTPLLVRMLWMVVALWRLDQRQTCMHSEWKRPGAGFSDCCLFSVSSTGRMYMYEAWEQLAHHRIGCLYVYIVYMLACDIIAFAYGLLSTYAIIIIINVFWDLGLVFMNNARKTKHHFNSAYHPYATGVLHQWNRLHLQMHVCI